MTSPESKGSNIERHLQTILISIITGAIFFSASYFFNDKSDKAVLSTQLAALTSQVVDMRAELRSMQAVYGTKDVDADHEARLRILERKLVK